jgi:hypothetical protein
MPDTVEAIEGKEIGSKMQAMKERQAWIKGELACGKAEDGSG